MVSKINPPSLGSQRSSRHLGRDLLAFLTLVGIVDGGLNEYWTMDFIIQHIPELSNNQQLLNFVHANGSALLRGNLPETPFAKSVSDMVAVMLHHYKPSGKRNLNPTRLTFMERRQLCLVIAYLLQDKQVREMINDLYEIKPPSTPSKNPNSTTPSKKKS